MMDEISIQSSTSSINAHLEKDKPPTILLNLCTDLAKSIREEVILVIGQLHGEISFSSEIK